MAKLYAMTGGATGIGQALRNQLIERGDKIIVVDLKDADINADLATVAGREAAVAGIKTLAPEGLDGFVACAGLGPHAQPKSIIDRVNFFGAVHCIEGVRELVAQRRGSIVAVSSNSAPMLVDPEHVALLLSGEEEAACAKIDACEDFEAGFNAYCGSKHALAVWVRRQAPEYAKLGVRLNAIAPGPTQTPLLDGVTRDVVFKDSMAEAANTIPMGQLGQPAMIADAIEFLLGDASRFVAGSVLFVDGGQDALMRPDQF